jgi:hypothetical protein
MPTRGRVEMAKNSIDSLFDNVTDQSNIEVLIAVDNDDSTATELQTMVDTHKNKDCIRIYTFERFGYKDLHKYLNALCEKSTGKYFVLWNDDAKIMTQNYDIIFKEIIETQDKLYVWQMPNNHGYDILPIMPREWYEVCGYFSAYNHTDSWIQYIADKLGVNRQSSIHAWHYRGVNVNDPIYSEVNEECRISHKLYHSDDSLRIRNEDVEKLRWSLYRD